MERLRVALWVAECRCGVQHTSLSWEALPLVGAMDPEDDEAPFAVLELRNCTCKSTIAIRKQAPDFEGKTALLQSINERAARERAARERKAP